MAKPHFSGVLQLSNVNDFLGPSQECIKPIEVQRVDTSTKSSIEVGSDGVYREVAEDGSVKTLQRAKISLADCLACSGCVTTAESVLVEAQSVAELVRVLNRTEGRPKVVVVSISPQTLASIAASANLTLTQVYFRLNTLFRRYFGAHYVFDLFHARQVALAEAAIEFCRDFEKAPILASACPGWICYAEKNSSNFDVLQHISTVKSPQQIMGSLVKKKLCETLTEMGEISPSDIYHVSMMPCFDKKLEASRSDFYSEQYRSHDVDLVLTSVEVPQLLQEANVANFTDLEETIMEPGLFNAIERDVQTGEWKVCGVSGPSGSFAEFVFQYAAKSIFAEDVSTPIELKTLVRPKGVKEVRLERDGKTLLAFATAYGFSNIANVVKQVKQGSAKYHYIEVMACPSGCVNGGGQLRLDSMSRGSNSMDVDQEETVILSERPKTARELLAAVEKIYSTQQSIHLDPFDDPIVQQLYKDLNCEPGDEVAKKMFHTSYHAMAKSEVKKNPLTIQW